MHVKAPTAAAIRSMRDLGAPQTQSDIIDWESILRLFDSLDSFETIL